MLLYHDLTAIHDVDTALGLVQTLTGDVVDLTIASSIFHLTSHIKYTCLVAEEQFHVGGRHFGSRETIQAEGGTAGTDGGIGLGIVELVGVTEEEDGVVGGGEGDLVVGADKGDALAVAEVESHFGLVVIDLHACEDRVNEVVGAIAVPFDDVGYAGYQLRDIIAEGEVKRAGSV